MFGVLPNTTARAPVDIVAANHGLAKLEQVQHNLEISNLPCKMRNPVPQTHKLRRRIFHLLLSLSAIIDLLFLTKTHIGR